jgi:hypothetical protein
MEILSMLAQGVGERLYPNLRPLLLKLFQLSKDKKLTKSTSACLDAFFGNVLSFAHILDSDSAIKEAVDERKERNAFARTNAMDFLGRCVTSGESAGPRGHLDASHAKEAALLACQKLKDSDANVRKAAVNALKTLQTVEDSGVQKAIGEIIQELESTNPRVYKSLAAGGGSKPESGVPKPSPPVTPQRQTAAPTQARPSAAASVVVPSAVAKKAQAPTPAPSGTGGDAANVDEAIERCASLGIPKWDAADEDAGIIAGLQCKYYCPKDVLMSLFLSLFAFIYSFQMAISPDRYQRHRQFRCRPQSSIISIGH